MFADDTKCGKRITCTDDAALIQHDLDTLCDGVTSDISSSRHLNVSCVIGKSEPSTIYTVNDSLVPAQSSHRDLGVTVSSDRSRSCQIDLVVSRAYKILGLVCRTFSPMNSVSEKRTLYLSLVLSQIVYCSEIWHPCLV